jgi:signal transduction histidine kinase
MASIVDELLLLSEVRKGDVILQQVVLMAEVMPLALERVDKMRKQCGGEIVLPESWPAVLGYAGWIEEVWVNYLSNGLKYGGPSPRLICGCDHLHDQMIRFWVKDHGPGIPPEKQAELFAEFTRLEQARASGHGLGLSIAKRIVEKLGGEVGLESVPGEGCTFYFTLPVG